MAKAKESLLKGFVDELTAAIDKNKATPANAAQQPAVDPAQQAQAASQANVNAQDARTRLWQSLDNSYAQQTKQSNESYDRAIAQQDQAFMNRGMQRSSYAGQTLANMQKQKIEAQNQIASNQIADYQSRLNALEQQELENQRYERQFEYQQERDKIADAFNERQFQAQQDQWKQQFEYNKKTAEQQLAFNVLMNSLEKGDNPSDKLLKQAGISRKDYEQMKTKAVKTSGGRSSGGAKTPWAQLGITEEQFKAQYPNEYAIYTGGQPQADQQSNDPWASLQSGLAGVDTTPAPSQDDKDKKQKQLPAGGSGRRWDLTK